LQPPFPPSPIDDISFTRTRSDKVFPGKRRKFDAFLLIRVQAFRCSQWLGTKVRARFFSGS